MTPEMWWELYLLQSEPVTEYSKYAHT